MNSNQISMSELFKKLNHIQSDELILDVRSKEEYRSGHVPGSKNIPHSEVKSHLQELGKFKRIFLHCQAGGRASMAAEELKKLGLNNIVCISSSGMGDWIASGYPIEK